MANLKAKEQVIDIKKLLAKLLSDQANIAYPSSAGTYHPNRHSLRIQSEGNNIKMIFTFPGGDCISITFKEERIVKILSKLQPVYVFIDVKHKQQYPDSHLWRLIVEKLKNLHSAYEIQENNNPYFVINTIAYVGGSISDDIDSSDEEYDRVVDSDVVSFDLKKQNYQLGDNPKSCSSYSIIENNNTNNSHKKQQESSVVQPLLDKLAEQGLDKDAKEDIENIVSISIGLNRPRSLSSRYNNLLYKEFNSKISSNIRCKRFYMFWEYTWYKDGKVVPYHEVRSFYKKLKRYDRGLAKKFLQTAERRPVNVPYQSLREKVKNHYNTFALVKRARATKQFSDVYISFIDSDVVNFNGIYSSYLKIYKETQCKPTVMSTGYEFTLEREDDHPFVEASKLNRHIRIATAKIFQWGTYYPEPNFCVLIEENLCSLTESFVDKNRNKGLSLESPVLIGNILKNRRNRELVGLFSNLAPLFTSIPPRARKPKGRKFPIRFSDNFKEGGKPNDKDIYKFNKITQSMTDPVNLAGGLYYNNAFKLTGDFRTYEKKLIPALFKATVMKDINRIKTELSKRIPEKYFSRVIKAVFKLKSIMGVYSEHMTTINVASVKQLNIFIRASNDNSQYEKIFLNIIASANIIYLLRGKILNLQYLAKLEYDVLRDILYNEQVIERLKKKMKIDNVITIHSLSFNHYINFDILFDAFLSAKYKGYENILDQWNNNMLHWEFMSGDPTDIMYTNSDDFDIIKFGVSNYNNDIDYGSINNQLGDTNNMIFQNILNNISPYNDEYDDTESDLKSDMEIENEVRESSMEMKIKADKTTLLQFNTSKITRPEQKKQLFRNKNNSSFLNSFITKKLSPAYQYPDYTIIPNQDIDGLKQVKIPAFGSCCFEAIFLGYRNQYPNMILKNIHSHKDLRKNVCNKITEAKGSFDIKVRHIRTKLRTTNFCLKNNLSIEKAGVLVLPENEQKELCDVADFKQLLETLQAARKFYNFSVSFGNIDKYVEDMLKPSKYGGQPELLCMANILKCKISIHTEQQPNNPTVCGKQYANEIHIAHVPAKKYGANKNHYNLLVNKWNWQLQQKCLQKMKNRPLGNNVL